MVWQTCPKKECSSISALVALCFISQCNCNIDHLRNKRTVENSVDIAVIANKLNNVEGKIENNSLLLQSILERSRVVNRLRSDPGVFQGASNQGNYMLTFEDGKEFCESRGTYIASLRDLQNAWFRGYEICACGWLSDGSARYPMQIKRSSGCGGVGINLCKSQTKSNVFCKSKGT